MASGLTGSQFMPALRTHFVPSCRVWITPVQQFALRRDDRRPFSFQEGLPAASGLGHGCWRPLHPATLLLAPFTDVHSARRGIPPDPGRRRKNPINPTMCIVSAISPILPSQALGRAGGSGSKTGRSDLFSAAVGPVGRPALHAAPTTRRTAAALHLASGDACLHLPSPPPGANIWPWITRHQR